MKIEEHEQYRLGRVPFLLMWIASFGVAWFIYFWLVLLWDDFTEGLSLVWSLGRAESPFYWRSLHMGWVTSLLSPSFGLAMGIILGLQIPFMQKTLFRWRYGFAPRFWYRRGFIAFVLV